MKLNLLSKLIIGLIAGILLGYLGTQLDFYAHVRAFSTFNSIFGNFLKFLIPILIVTFVAPGIADLGKGAGKLLAITAAIAYVSAICAGLAAYFTSAAILPKFIKTAEAVEKSSLNVDAWFTVGMPPPMDIMTALVLSFVLGVGMAYLKTKALYNVMTDLQKIIRAVIDKIVIPFIPFHICGIFMGLTAKGEIVATIITFGSVFAVILGLQALYVIIQYSIAGALSGKAPHKCIKNMLPAYFTALGTQSSAATIPVTLESVRKNGVHEEIVDFVVPLCATIHLAGDTITLVVAAMGVMLMDGSLPTFSTMLPYILMLGITMVAAPGIPGGGVYAALGLLEKMLLFDQAKQGLMIAIHFGQDSFGTATNVSGDGAIAMIVNKIENRQDSSPSDQRLNDLQQEINHLD